jgi:hypothetical protein
MRIGLHSAAAGLCILGLATLAPESAPQPQPIARSSEQLPGNVEKPRSARSASYAIAVRLDHGARRLRGRQTVRWQNVTSRATSDLWFHLYWNAWRDHESTWMRERRSAGTAAPVRLDAWASIDVTALRVSDVIGVSPDLAAAIRFIAPDDGNAADRTLARVPLPRAVQPGEAIQVDVEWTARIPRPFLRTGYVGSDYLVAHWFPKIAVLGEHGWAGHQFHYTTEFYADFGVYDVEITVPSGFVVGASGREVGRAGNGDGTVTYRYRGEDIHDFAWTASPRYVEVRRAVAHAAADGGRRQVEVRLLMQPERLRQASRVFEAAKATLSLLGKWVGAYPYDQLTIVDPPFESRTGGMEYPTLITAGSRWLAPESAAVPEAVTIHETVHQWWHTVVAASEFEHAWMDEGLATYLTSRILDEMAHPQRLTLRLFGGFVPWVVSDIRLQGWDNSGRASYRRSPSVDAPSTPSYRYAPASAAAITYAKSALWLQTLERHLGWPVMQRVLRTYFDRWQFRHPAPGDFFAIVNEVSGRDLTWFFDQVHDGSAAFDYAIAQLASAPSGSGFRTTVVAERHTDAVFPVDVVTTFESGEQAVERWDGGDRRVTFAYDRPSRATRADVDPRRVLVLDLNFTNNSRTLQPRADDASLKWAAKWMVWLQDVMLTYAFFG